MRIRVEWLFVYALFWLLSVVGAWNAAWNRGFSACERTDKSAGPIGTTSEWHYRDAKVILCVSTTEGYECTENAKGSK